MKGSRTDLVIAAAFCGTIGLYDALYVILMLSDGPVIGPELKVLDRKSTRLNSSHT